MLTDERRLAFFPARTIVRDSQHRKSLHKATRIWTSTKSNFRLCSVKLCSSVCNFQSMKSPVELNSLLLKFFCYVNWFDERRHWRPFKWCLFVKSYCFFEAIAKWFKNYKLSCDKHHTKALHDTTRGYYTQHYTLRYTQHHQALHGTTRRAILVTFVISCVTIFQI